MTVSPSDAVADDRPSTTASPESPTDQHDAAEGTNGSSASGVGSESTLRSMLMSTSPEKDLENVESPFDTEKGGLTRVARGVQKALGASGIPAVVDVAVGLAEFVVGADVDDAGDEQDAGDGRVEDEINDPAVGGGARG